jgi:hypothetical protein
MWVLILYSRDRRRQNLRADNFAGGNAYYPRSPDVRVLKLAADRSIIMAVFSIACACPQLEGGICGL